MERERNGFTMVCECWVTMVGWYMVVTIMSRFSLQCDIFRSWLVSMVGWYSSLHLVVERMEELMEGTSLEESGWFQRERSFKLPVLCRGMVGFGQRRIFGTAGKEHPSPPLPSPAVGEVLKPVELQLEVMD